MFSLLKQQYQKLREWLDLYSVTLADDPKLYAYGDYSYRKCVDWFGQVKDSHWPYEICYAFRASLTKSPFRKCYQILVWRTCKDYEPLYEGIGHEMYHRVTGAHKGLRQMYWLDEMLAFLTARHLLYDFGQGEYADYMAQLYSQYDAMRLKELSLLRPRRGPGSYTYFPPESFVSGILKIGISLEKIVGWEHICSLVHCQTWDQWLAQLPDAMRQEAHRLLLPAIDSSAIIPFDASEIKHFRRLKSRSKYPNPIIKGKPKIDWENHIGKYRRKISSTK